MHFITLFNFCSAASHPPPQPGLRDRRPPLAEWKKEGIRLPFLPGAAALAAYEPRDGALGGHAASASSSSFFW
ncbi:hypothetical protein KAM364_18260 [Aeromonas caviae]|nr:hypothetical protein KAM364_18260 [Aeromonas caviae]